MDVSDAEERLGAALRRRRIDAGLTQSELADRASVSLSALRSLERGMGSNTSTLLRVASALGLDRWIDTLAPTDGEFNPLDLLSGRARATVVRQRVRRHRAR